MRAILDGLPEASETFYQPVAAATGQYQSAGVSQATESLDLEDPASLELIELETQVEAGPTPRTSVSSAPARTPKFSRQAKQQK